MTSRPSVLYISYDGVLEPLGQSQVLAYLEGLADAFAIHLVSYEKPDDWRDRHRRAAMVARLRRAGIKWHPRRYHRRPTVPATLFDIGMGIVLSLWLALRFRVGAVHARSTIPALIGLIVKRLTGARLLFDIRGFWADERVDGGLWPVDGRLYRVVRRIEHYLYGRADHIVTLTEASCPIIRQATASAVPITVIPTCADLTKFTPAEVPPTIFTLGYVGSIGTWYCFDEVLACFRLVRERQPDARLLIVNRSQREQVHAAIANAAIDPASVEVAAAEHDEVPVFMRRMTAGVALVRPAPSKRASAPTKLAEYLGCGLPCLGNHGVGDMTTIIERERVGIVVAEFSPEARRVAVDRLLDLCAEPGIAARCRKVAIDRFSAETGVACYREIYRELLA